MERVVQALSASRVWLGLVVWLYVAPAALRPVVMVGEGELAPAPASAEIGGLVLTPLIVALLVIWQTARFDRKTIRAGQEPRLGLTTDRYGWGVGAASRAAVLTAGVLAAIGAALLFGRAFGLALGVVVAWLLAAVLTGGVEHARGRTRQFLVELVWPLVMIVGPVLVLRRVVIDAGGVVPEIGWGGVLSLALLGAVGLAVLALLCQVRDLPVDTAAGQWTSATILGRRGACLLVLAGLAVFVVLASRGAGLGYWHWGVGAIAGAASLATVWGLAEQNDHALPGWWWLVLVAVGAAAAL